MSGCAICVYDLYEDSRAAYAESLHLLHNTLAVMKVPMAEWPPEILSTSQISTKKDISLSAFEDMERALRERRLPSDGEKGGTGDERNTRS